MAYNYLTQHTPQTVGGGGGCSIWKAKMDKNRFCPSNLLHIPCSSASYPLWYQSEIYDIVSPWILSQTNCKQILDYGWLISFDSLKCHSNGEISPI